MVLNSSMQTTPLNWLNSFHESIMGTEAKLNGKTATLAEGLKAIQDLFKVVRARDGAVWWVGNGGSNGLCSHLSQDMLNKLGMRSQTFSDAALLTCMANDFGYPEVYARPLRTLAKKDDLLIAISSSGKSANILNSCQVAEEKGMSIITLSAFSSDNPLWARKADVSLFVKSSLYGLVEVGHEALLHSAIETMWLGETKNK